MISLLPLLPERDDLAPDMQRAAQYIVNKSSPSCAVQRFA